MKYCLLIGLFFGLFIISGKATAQEEEIRLIEFYHDFGGNFSLDYNGKSTLVPQKGFGINTTLGKKIGGAFASYTCRFVDMEGLNISGLGTVLSHEFFVGTRYYPFIPTFLIGPVAFRLTGTAALGFDWNFDLRFMYQAGFEISPVRSTLGLTVHFFNSLGPFNVAGYPGESFWAFRIGMMMGPSFE